MSQNGWMCRICEKLFFLRLIPPFKECVEGGMKHCRSGRKMKEEIEESLVDAPACYQIGAVRLQNALMPFENILAA